MLVLGFFKIGFTRTEKKFVLNEDTIYANETAIFRTERN